MKRTGTGCQHIGHFWQVILTLGAQALAAGTGWEAFDRGSLGRRAGKATAAALQLANFDTYVPARFVPLDVALRPARRKPHEHRHVCLGKPTLLRPSQPRIHRLRPKDGLQWSLSSVLAVPIN